MRPVSRALMRAGSAGLFLRESIKVEKGDSWTQCLAFFLGGKREASEGRRARGGERGEIPWGLKRNHTHT